LFVLFHFGLTSCHHEVLKPLPWHASIVSQRMDEHTSHGGQMVQDDGQSSTV
jgi:hypothetical protein